MQTEHSPKSEMLRFFCKNKSGDYVIKKKGGIKPPILLRKLLLVVVRSDACNKILNCFDEVLNELNDLIEEICNVVHLFSLRMSFFWFSPTIIIA